VNPTCEYCGADGHYHAGAFHHGSEGDAQFCRISQRIDSMADRGVIRTASKEQGQ
jgi:hypothetical protein